MAKKSGTGFSVGGRSADDRTVAASKALAAGHRKKRARAARESADLERSARRVGAAIRRSVREAERQHMRYITVRPARRSGSRKSRTICPRFETMLNLNLPRPSHVGGDGLSSFHYKWTSRGLSPRAGQKNSHRYRPGEAVNHVRYILRDDAREVPGSGIISNISTDADEIASLFGAVEDLEQIGGQANANIYCSIVIALPKELDTAGRERVLGEIAAELDAEELPHAFVLHKPDARGSQDNWHAHGILSLRPFRKRDDGGYDFAAAPSSDLNNGDFIYHLREIAARAMNAEMEQARKKRRFTPLSYADRGLDIEGEAKKGPGRKAIERRQEDILGMQAEQGLLTRFVRVVEGIAERARDLAIRPAIDRAARLGALRDHAASLEAGRARIADAAPAPQPVAGKNAQATTAGDAEKSMDGGADGAQVDRPIGNSQSVTRGDTAQSASTRPSSRPVIEKTKTDDPGSKVEGGTKPPSPAGEAAPDDDLLDDMIMRESLRKQRDGGR